MAQTESKNTKARKVVVTWSEGNEETFNSIKKAAKILGLNSAHLQRHLMHLSGCPKVLKEQGISVRLLNDIKWVDGVAVPVEE